MKYAWKTFVLFWLGPSGSMLGAGPGSEQKSVSGIAGLGGGGGGSSGGGGSGGGGDGGSGGGGGGDSGGGAGAGAGGGSGSGAGGGGGGSGGGGGGSGGGGAGALFSPPQAASTPPIPIPSKPLWASNFRRSSVDSGTEGAASPLLAGSGTRSAAGSWSRSPAIDILRSLKPRKSWCRPRS